MNTKVKIALTYAVIVVSTLWTYDRAQNWWNGKSKELVHDLTTREIANALKDIKLTCDKKVCTNQGEALTTEQALGALYVTKLNFESCRATLQTVNEMTLN